MPINVLIADDDELIRSSLKLILEMDGDIHVTGTCSNGDEAYKAVLNGAAVDVILMDIRMPVCDGVISTKKILETRSDIKVIILTTFDDDEYIFEALKNGAKGYLLKNVSPDKILEAVKVVNNGSLLVHRDIAGRLPKMLRKESGTAFDGKGLGETEVNIIRLIADGYTNREIADRVFLSEGTVKNKISDILDKLGLRDRTQIAIYYLKGGRI